MLNLQSFTFRNSTDAYSSVVAAVWLVLMLVLVAVVVGVLLTTRPGYADDKAEDSRLAVLFRDFKTSSAGTRIANCWLLSKFNLCLLDNVMFVSRRVVIVCVALFVVDSGLLQLVILLSC